MKVIVPARLESSRLRRKLIASVCGKEVLRHCIEGLLGQGFDSGDVIVLTDSEAIYTRVVSWQLGVKCELRAYNAKCGTQRVHEYILSSPDFEESILIWQGDEVVVTKDEVYLAEYIERFDPHFNYNFYHDISGVCFPEGAVQVIGDKHVSGFSREIKPRPNCKGLHVGAYLLNSDVFFKYPLSIWDDYADDIEMNALIRLQCSIELAEFVPQNQLRVVQVNVPRDIDVLVNYL